MFALSAQTEDLTNYPADVYQVEIIDSNNCFYEMFFEIVQPDTLKIEYTYTVVSCKDGSDGNIFVNITGGNPGYTTVWSNGATTEDLLNIPADVYELVVTDTKNCMDSITTTIAEPDSVKMNFTFEEVTCIDQHDGVAYVYPYGGNGGYFYNWSNGEVTSVNDGLSNQWYSVTITDILGCVGTDSVFITKNNDDCVDPVSAFTPNDDNYNDEWFIRNMELYPDAEMQIFNRWGNLIHHQTGVYVPWDGYINGAEAPSDTYYYILNLNYPGRDILTGNITIVR
jgi:gliding motility-associated-like protein